MTKIRIHHSSTFIRGKRELAKLTLERNAILRKLKDIERQKKALAKERKELERQQKELEQNESNH